MTFRETNIDGVFEIQIEPRLDDRGFFARCWCQREFERIRLNATLVQCSLSFSRKKGTLRGMHYQAAPHTEVKLVRCTAGSVYDVVLDLRPYSPTYRGWTAVILDCAKRNMVYVPEGCAHGFLTLADETEVFYQMSQFYDPATASGVRWDDPAFQIQWPAEPGVISERDRSYPSFE